MMHRQRGMMFYCGMFIVAAFSLNLLGPAITSAQEEGPATVCVLQMAASGDVMAVVVDDSRDIDIAVVVPRDNITNLPIRCMDLDRLGLAVANQEPFQVTLRTNIYTNKGELKCSKGPFNINANGGRGVNFEDCL